MRAVQARFLSMREIMAISQSFAAAAAPWLVLRPCCLCVGDSASERREPKQDSGQSTKADAETASRFSRSTSARCFTNIARVPCRLRQSAGSGPGARFLRRDHSGRQSRAAVRGRDPDASLLLRAVRYDDVDLQMPPDASCRMQKSSVGRVDSPRRAAARIRRRRRIAESRHRHRGRPQFLVVSALSAPTPPRVRGDLWSRVAGGPVHSRQAGGRESAT